MWSCVPAIDIDNSNLYRLARETPLVVGLVRGSMESRSSPVGIEGILHW